MIRERLRIAQSRQKSYADNRRRDLEFEIGDFVFLKVSPWKGVVRFRGKGKLAPRYIGPYQILDRIGAAAYRLSLPAELSRLHDVFHVSNLRKYLADPSHVLAAVELEIQDDLSYAEHPLRIVDRKEQVLRSKVIHWVKVIWSNHGAEEATWEGEEDMRSRYPHLFVPGTTSIFEDENS